MLCVASVMALMLVIIPPSNRSPTITWCARLGQATGMCPVEQKLLRIEPALKAAVADMISDALWPTRPEVVLTRYRTEYLVSPERRRAARCPASYAQRSF